jgi:hypothetical protein
LRRFRAEEWQVDGEPPPHWPTDPERVGLWYGIQAHSQWMQARRDYEAETGVHIMFGWEQRRQAAREARSLAGLNEPYHPDVFVEDGEPDPRWEPMS